MKSSKKSAQPGLPTTGTFEVVSASADGPTNLPIPEAGAKITIVMRRDRPASIGRPLDEDEPKDHVITIRTTRTRKNAYVKAAQKSPQKNLTDWMITQCDRALD